jgi:PPOX class probable F420-dependent enzyme
VSPGVPVRRSMLDCRILGVPSVTRLAAMRKRLSPDDLDGLLERPLVAVLATYRANGNVLLSPVWHRWRHGGFDVVTGGDDVKVRHLRGDTRASIVVFEHDPPYRGIEVGGRVMLGRADADVVREIAVRYLGDEEGGAYADRGYDDTLIRLEPGRLRAWDFADDL